MTVLAPLSTHCCCCHQKQCAQVIGHAALCSYSDYTAGLFETQHPEILVGCRHLSALFRWSCWLCLSCFFQLFFFGVASLCCFPQLCLFFDCLFLFFSWFFHLDYCCCCAVNSLVCWRSYLLFFACQVLVAVGWHCMAKWITLLYLTVSCASLTRSLWSQSSSLYEATAQTLLLILLAAVLCWM